MPVTERSLKQQKEEILADIEWEALRFDYWKALFKVIVQAHPDATPASLARIVGALMIEYDIVRGESEDRRKNLVDKLYALTTLPGGAPSGPTGT